MNGSPSEIKPKGIISLTSWKGRINIVHRIIENLGKMCPDFRIVLVLSEDEFPNRVIPYTLDNVHILWVQKNLKSFKKILYTMEKFPEYPIISADDDAIYSIDYATELHDMWQRFPDCIISNFPNVKTGGIKLPNGYCTLYPPHCLDGALLAITDNIVSTNNDDGFYGVWLALQNREFKYIMKKDLATFCDEANGMQTNHLYKAGNSDIKVIIRELYRHGKINTTNELFLKKWEIYKQ